jgi:BirA family biotin operon repressor/biotin-[acetyl-CoA-carboxylase] ligase
MIRRIASCGSTNDEAAKWAREGAPAFSVVVADAQTHGRGRLGRVWQSPPGENLYFSTVLRPAISPQHAAPITLAAGVAVAEALTRIGAAPTLKWPNDVLVSGKKIAGILSEMSTRGMRLEHVIVGIGVNVLSHPPELPTTSICKVLGHAIDRDAVLDEVLASLRVWHDRFIAHGPAPIVEAWRAHCNFFGARVTVTSGVEKLTGIAEALESDGALRLRTDDGVVHRIVAGELASTGDSKN